MFSLHDDKTITFEGRDVATLRPGLPATRVDRIEGLLADVRLDREEVYTAEDLDKAIEEAEMGERSRAIREASDAVLEACNALDSSGADKTITKFMQAVQAAKALGDTSTQPGTALGQILSRGGGAPLNPTPGV